MRPSACHLAGIGSSPDSCLQAKLKLAWFLLMNVVKPSFVPRPDPHSPVDVGPATLDFHLRLPELLAPAGDWDCARAAVENGADAIYFGLDKFNARMRARNFTEADLPRLMDFLRHRGVKGYVTLNTLVFENELAEAEMYL